MTKKILCFLLAMSMAFSLALPASANSQDVPISVDIEAASISVTVPTNLPISVDSNGDSVTEVEAYIENHSAAQVYVTDIEVFGIGGWELKDWDTNWKTSGFGTKEFAIKINGEAVPANGIGDVSKFDPIDGDGRESFTYEGRIAPQNDSGTATIGTVVFTVGWVEAIQYIPTGGTYYAVNGEVYHAGEPFPKFMNTNDYYTYGDYKYTYNSFLYEFNSVEELIAATKESVVEEYGVDSWEDALELIKLEIYEAEGVVINDEDEFWEYCGIDRSATNIGEWSVVLNENVTNRNQETYGIILPKINNVGNLRLEATFKDCVNLKNTPLLPNSVIYMSSTFENCTALEKVSNIPNNNNLTGLHSVFKGCISLIETPYLPDNITGLWFTFSNCESLKKVTNIPINIESLTDAFAGCTSLTSIPDLANHLKLDDMNSTFWRCYSLTAAPTIPENVTQMFYTFDGCSALSGEIVINTNHIYNNDSSSSQNSATGCFRNVDMSKITLAGDASKEVLNLIGSTGDNWTPIQ